MKYYIKDWFSKLKHSKSYTVIIKKSNESLTFVNSSSNSELETFTSSENEDQPKNSGDDNAKNVLNKANDQINTHFQSLYAFVVFNFYLLCFLVNFCNSEHKLNGLLFLLSLVTITTFLIFYYPIYRLTITGHINLRILKWIYGFLLCCILTILIKDQPQACSSFFVSASVSIKWFREIPIFFPSTFTYNELVLLASIFANGLFAFCMHFSLMIPTINEEVIVIEQALIWLFLTLLIIAKLKIFRNSIIGFVSGCVLILAVQFTPACLLFLNKNPFIWLFNFLFNDASFRINIFLSWIGLFSCLIVVISIQRYFEENIITNQQIDNWNEKKAGKNLHHTKHTLLTSMRKIFHLLICVVYLIGLFYDRHLLFLCSFGMFIILVLVETIRYHKIGILSIHIEESFRIFIDEKDAESRIILSHFYLLIGLSFPFWISNIDQFRLCQLSGLITVGVGDSFASLIGSRYGKHKIPGCKKKSLEGSLGLIISELLSLVIFSCWGFFKIFNLVNILIIIAFLITTSFVEAYTNDNDNLILPIVAYPFLVILQL